MNSDTENNTANSSDQNSAVQPVTVTGEYALLGDLEMYYEIHGTGRPLILLHGAFMSAAVYPALAANRQVIAVDLRVMGAPPTLTGL